MPATIAVHEVHPDLPVDRAWRQGRRLYARCSRHSRLSAQLHAMGAKWDVKEKALWVGSGKRDRFTTLALGHHAAATRAQEIKAAGHRATIPYDAILIRARANELGAVWDPDSKQWALPTPADQIEILDLVQVWQQARDAEREQRHREELERREQQAREARLEAAGVRERERRQAAREAVAYRQALAHKLGRTLTSQVETRREIYPRFTSRQAAQDAACTVGQVLRLEDGRRALVTDQRIGYVPAEKAHLYGQEHAHRYVEYQLAVVMPTEDELDDEVTRATEAMDAQEIRALVTDAALLTFPAAGDRRTPVPEREGTITITTGVNGLIPAGHLILARDGTLWWQHPGRYDDYVRAEGWIRDSDLAAAMRHLLAAGPRRRVIPGNPPVYYEVHTDA